MERSSVKLFWKLFFTGAILIWQHPLGLFAQHTSSLQLEKSIRHEGVSMLCQANESAFFVFDNQQRISRYSLKGEMELQATLSAYGAVSHIGFDRSNRLFAFVQDRQVFFYLDRFLRPSSLYPIQAESATFFNAACPSTSNTVWLASDQEQLLIHLDPTTGKELMVLYYQDFLKGKTAEVMQLVYYQNRLYFLSRENQLYVIDRFGKMIQSFEINNSTPIHFTGDTLYYIEGNVIKCHTLYSNSTYAIKPPSKKDYKDVIINGAYFVLSGTDGIDIYQQKP